MQIAFLEILFIAANWLNCLHTAEKSDLSYGKEISRVLIGSLVV